MIALLRGGLRLGAAIFALGLLLATTSNAFAHARYDYSDPPSGSALDGSPFVLRAWFTQELTSRSTIQVLDANGVQVDLGDGHVDLDDPDRKMMVVSVPELPPGIYTVHFSADSAEDGHMYPGAFAFGVGMEAPAGEIPLDEPAAAPEQPAAAPEAPAASPVEPVGSPAGPTGGSSSFPCDNVGNMVLDAY